MNVNKIIRYKYNTLDGVTRGEEVTPGLALSLGLNADGRHPRIRIYDGGWP